MTRPAGSRNLRYDERRTELARRLRQRLAAPGRAGLRELAECAGVTVPTLKHYFGDRDGVVKGVLEAHSAFSGPHMQALRQPSGSFGKSIVEACAYIDLGLAIPVVTELHIVGLIEGVAHEECGPYYLGTMLEPILQAVEVRLSAHIARGEMRAADLRAAALQLVAPIYLAHLHQRLLGGAQLRPLDSTAHRSEHVEAFLRAYQLSLPTQGKAEGEGESLAAPVAATSE